MSADLGRTALCANWRASSGCQVRQLERTATGPAFSQIVEMERRCSCTYGGRSVFSWEPAASSVFPIAPEPRNRAEAGFHEVVWRRGPIVARSRPARQRGQRRVELREERHGPGRGALRSHYGLDQPAHPRACRSFHRVKERRYLDRRKVCEGVRHRVGEHDPFTVPDGTARVYDVGNISLTL